MQPISFLASICFSFGAGELSATKLLGDEGAYELSFPRPLGEERLELPGKCSSEVPSVPSSSSKMIVIRAEITGLLVLWL